MSDYKIVTDSSCDLEESFLKEMDIECVQLDILIDGKEPAKNNTIDIKDFYDGMRNGLTAKTSAVNIADFKDEFTKILDKGLDIIYLGFSSGLSTTFNSSKIAAEELKEVYPDRKILVIDTLCASLGQGLLVYLAYNKKKDGYTIDELFDYIEYKKISIAHTFTVDSLQYLKRGGRVSPSVAFIGGLMNIKPMMHVDNEGKLVVLDKVRGRKNSLDYILERYEKNAIPGGNDAVFICHGDCIEDAEYISDVLKLKYGVKFVYIYYVGAVIGSHSGPGTLSIFYVGNER